MVGVAPYIDLVGFLERQQKARDQDGRDTARHTKTVSDSRNILFRCLRGRKYGDGDPNPSNLVLFVSGGLIQAIHS